MKRRTWKGNINEIFDEMVSSENCLCNTMIVTIKIRDMWRQQQKRSIKWFVVWGELKIFEMTKTSILSGVWFSSTTDPPQWTWEGWIISKLWGGGAMPESHKYIIRSTVDYSRSIWLYTRDDDVIDVTSWPSHCNKQWTGCCNVVAVVVAVRQAFNGN